MVERWNGRPDRPLSSPSAGGRQTDILSLKKGFHGKKGIVVIPQHLAPDAYGLLILAPQIALADGWLGGDRVVGRAAVRDLLKKAGRFNDDERERMTIHLPDSAVTLRLDEVERQLGG